MKSLTILAFVASFGQFVVQVQPPFTVTVQSQSQTVEQPRVYLAMFTADWCGPCQQWKRSVKPQLESRGQQVQIVEMTVAANRQKFGRKITRYPAFVVCDWYTGKWLTEPRFGTISATTAEWMLDSVTPLKPLTPE